MIDPVSATTAATLLAAGWLVGRYARLKATPRPPTPICMCGHHYGTHDPEGGYCVAEFTERFQAKPGGSLGDVRRRCSCVRYTGPQPVEQYWVPPAADMSIVTAPRPVEDGNR